MRFSERIKNVFLDYSLLFKNLKKEGIWPSIAFYAVFAFLLLIIDWILIYNDLIPANAYIVKTAEITEFVAFFVPLYLFGVNMAILYLYPAVLYKYLKSAGEKTSLKGNIKIFAHSSLPFMLTAWIIGYNVIFLLWSAYLIARGVSETYGTGFGKSLKAVFAAGVTTGIFAFLLSYLMVLYLGIEFNIKEILLTRK